MSFNNATSDPLFNGWQGFDDVYRLIPTSTPALSFLALINIPTVVILLNVLRQLVLPRNPSLPPEVFHWIPFVGSAVGYGTDPINFLTTCQKKHGNVFTFVLLGRKMTVALSSKGNNFIFGGKVANLSAEDAYTHMSTPIFGKDVVFDCPNEKLMEQKRFIKVGLSTENFRAYVGMVEDEVLDYMNRDPKFLSYQAKDAASWGQFDPVTVLAEMTILTATRTLQGNEVRSGMDKTFAALFADLDGGLTPLNFMFANLPLESYRKRDRAQKKLSDFYVNIIKARRSGQTNNDETDMIAALMTQSYRSGTVVPDHEIAHIMIALLMAGQHTSSTTGSWAMLHLAANPDVADTVYQEQIAKFSNPDGSLRSPTYDELRNLPVLDSVIRETLRLHPPIHNIMRKVRADLVVPPSLASPSKDGYYIVPKGYFVLASPVVSQVDPDLWYNASKWEPSRWNDSEGQAQKAFRQYTDENGEKFDYGFGAVGKGTESPYQPFGAGRHRCIGEQFAYLQLGTLVVTMVRSLEMEIASGVPKPSFHTLIPTPKQPRMISYHRRQLDKA
ncbi:lanosterol 14-alpha-demethylase [Artomyces pyxidatus]|uniref:Lanosterol 14-alpha-demethylase n=1 Tax=Artomyces pyxidatus TaxID=48021 RepID=A0ACB8TJU1_9AGAM|nr:lanosterol 14-alpha-demethylase [Artomyces pyxidatus]